MYIYVYVSIRADETHVSCWFPEESRKYRNIREKGVGRVNGEIGLEFVKFWTETWSKVG